MQFPVLFRRLAFLGFWIVGFATAPTVQGGAVQDSTGEPLRARGRVFIDCDGDGRFGSRDIAFSGIRVSNGLDIVRTGAGGEYDIPLGPDGEVFVIKPTGYRTALSQDNLPRFYYLHKPDGSPQLKFPGVAPTGPLPQSIDFPLYRQTEKEAFKILLFGDPQPRDHKEVDYIAQDVVSELVGRTDHSFGVTLGDIAFDNLDTFEPLNQTIALIGIPWYNVIGNHDINTDVTERRFINETYERVYGPSYYSFDYGQVHFVVLDNIGWAAPDERVNRWHYEPRFGERQLEFLKRDLELIPASQMVVLMMHVPIVGTLDKSRVFELIQDRPYCISISGHTHDHQHLFLGPEDGFQGAGKHHHIVNVTVSGSWWSGAEDERGIPHTTMKDGAPNGYSVLSFDRQGYRLDFRAAGRPASEQLRIDVPRKLASAETANTPVWVNVFNGSEYSRVRMQIDGRGDWSVLEKREAVDPYFVRLYERDLNLDRPLTKPRPSSHLWYGELPPLEPGVHLLLVETTDRHGRVYRAQRSLRITP